LEELGGGFQCPDVDRDQRDGHPVNVGQVHTVPPEAVLATIITTTMFLAVSAAAA
jgi:hypothetical protein